MLQTRLDPMGLGTSDGLKAWYGRFQEALNDEACGLTLETVSLRRLWETLVGPVGETLSFAQSIRGVVDMPMREAAMAGMGTSVFEKATSELVSKKVIAAYDAVPGIGDLLVSNYPTKFIKEDFVGFDAIGDLDTIAELAPYPETGFGEKWAGTNKALKKGIVLGFSEECIFFDRTGQIVIQADQIGRAARRTKEKTILDALTDNDTTNYIYQPQGAGEVIYRTAVGTNSTTINLVASNGLVDYTDVEAALALFAGMTDSEGNRIGIPPSLKLIVPYALEGAADWVTNGRALALHVGGYATSGNLPEVTGPPRQRVNSIQVLSTALLDGYSASTWYLGDPARQFLWRDIWPIQVLRRGQDNTEDGWFRDVAVQFKVRYFGACACIDDKYVVQSEA